MIDSSKAWCGAVPALAATVLFSTSVLAQSADPADTSPADDSTQLQEVVVTAEKRTELIIKAPLAISAVSQANMDELGITTAQDLVTTVPNFQLSANGYTPQLSIRGIGNFSGSYSTVAVQVDGIYDPNTAALTNGLYDVQRIEVARGPQGTVYGRNATAGVLNIHTADPTRMFQAFGDIAYGNDSDITARAVLNVPLDANVQMRASIVRESNDGYYPRGDASQNYAKTDVLTARLVTQAEFGNNFTWRIALEHSSNTGTINYTQMVNYLYYPNASLRAGTPGSPVIVGPLHSDILGQQSVNANSVDTWENAVRSRLFWAVSDTLSATYLAGYSAFIDDGVDSANGAFSLSQKDSDTRALSHELDINWDPSGFHAVLGLYYYRDYNNGSAAIHIGNTVPNPFNTLVPGAINDPVGLEPSVYGLIDIDQHTAVNFNTSKAAFTQGTYSITDRLRLTGGVRYTRDTHGVEASSQVCAWGTGLVANAALNCGVPFGPPSTTAQSNGSDNTSWKASLDYDLTAAQLLYATVATGYRGGGVSGNTRLPAQYLTYAPETVRNYELGWKGQFLNRSLVASADIFDMDYNDMQVSAIEHDLTGTPTPVTINAAKSRIKGIETELDWRLTPVDEVRGYATYLDAKFTSFPNGVNATVNPDGIYNSVIGALDAAGAAYTLLATNVPTDFSGKFLPNAPQETFRVAYSHTFRFAGYGSLTPSADLYWQAKSYNDFANSIQAERATYTKTNLNLTYKNESGRLSVDAYVRNLENERVWQSANGKWDETTAYFMPPRTYGVRIGYRFE